MLASRAGRFAHDAYAHCWARNYVVAWVALLRNQFKLNVYISLTLSDGYTEVWKLTNRRLCGLRTYLSGYSGQVLPRLYAFPLALFAILDLGTGGHSTIALPILFGEQLQQRWCEMLHLPNLTNFDPHVVEGYSNFHI